MSRKYPLYFAGSRCWPLLPSGLRGALGGGWRSWQDRAHPICQAAVVERTLLATRPTRTTNQRAQIDQCQPESSWIIVGDEASDESPQGLIITGARLRRGGTKHAGYDSDDVRIDEWDAYTERGGEDSVGDIRTDTRQREELAMGRWDAPAVTLHDGTAERGKPPRAMSESERAQQFFDVVRVSLCQLGWSPIALDERPKERLD